MHKTLKIDPMKIMKDVALKGRFAVLAKYILILMNNFVLTKKT
jgi:hypothetical protein